MITDPPAVLHSPGTYTKRLKQAIRDGLAGNDAEAYVWATTDLAAVPHSERGRLVWICENVIWPKTRRRRAPAPNPTPLLTFPE